MKKHALENIMVVELGGYIVGSFCATMLAAMGADVIKIESLGGDGLRTILASFQGWNRGKRGISVDLRTEEGNKILRQLIVKSDVLVQNLRQGVAERWGADYETLREINPKLIYCAMPGYGQSGPYINKPAFDPLLQARSGVMDSQGGEGNPPVYLRSAACDYAGALLGAWGVATALYHRAKTGKGQYLHGALLNAAIAVQSGEFTEYEGKPEEQYMGTTGKNATYRIYKTADGWLFIGCSDEESWRKLCTVSGKPELLPDSRFSSDKERRNHMNELAEIFERVFSTATTQYWVDTLEKSEIICAPVNRFGDLLNNPQVLENNLIAEHESVDLGHTKQTGMLINLSKTPGKLQRAAPGLGQHNEEVLMELGYSEQEISLLREKRVIL